MKNFTPDLSITSSKKHHYIPQFILRNFSNFKNRKTLFSFDVENCDLKNERIKDILYSDCLYNSEIKEISLENAISQLESEIANVLYKINTSASIQNINLTVLDKFWLAKFMLLQISRTPSSKYNVKLAYEKTIYSLAEMFIPKQITDSFGPIKVDIREKAFHDIWLARHVINIPEEHVINIYEKFSIKICWTTTSEFVINDIGFAPGLGNIGIVLPISKNIALHFIKKEMFNKIKGSSIPDYYPDELDSTEVTYYNFKQIERTEKYIFGSSKKILHETINNFNNKILK